VIMYYLKSVFDEFHSEGGSSSSLPQVMAMSDIMAGTTLEDLEYSDDGDDLDSDEDDIDQVQ